MYTQTQVDDVGVCIHVCMCVYARLDDWEYLHIMARHFTGWVFTQVDAAVKKGDTARLPALESELETVECCVRHFI